MFKIYIIIIFIKKIYNTLSFFLKRYFCSLAFQIKCLLKKQNKASVFQLIRILIENKLKIISFVLKLTLKLLEKAIFIF